jgi:3-oxoadipate enol-lactonase
VSKIATNDISMYYEIHGQGEPIVFIAGFGVDHTMWNAIIDKFKDDYQIILFDNRGIGQTDVSHGAYSIEEMTSDVVTLCSKLGINRAHFVGNSMGGFIVQNIAFKHPKLVKSATLSNTASTIHTCFHIYLEAQLELLKAGAPLAALIKASSSWVFSIKFLSQPNMLKILIQQGLENLYPFTIRGYEGQYTALSQFDSRQWVSRIDVPTLVLSSNQDLIFSEQSVKMLAEEIPNAAYYCFSECGHLPMIEYPETFSKIIQEFINSKG